MQLSDYINFNTVLLLFSGFVNVFLFWKRGGQEATKELIDLQEKQIEAMKHDMDMSRERGHALANDIQKLSLKVGYLEGQAQEKDKKIEEYIAILQNRNPELETVLKSIEKFMHLINDKIDNAAAIVVADKKVLRKGGAK
jgi:predicted  nucleic acid-binding Zn-ribbon protein